MAKERSSYIAAIYVGIVLILLGFSLTMVGNFRKSSRCHICKDDVLKVAGPIMLCIGVFIVIVSIIRCRCSKFNQPNTTTTTTRLTTYNTTGPSQPGQAVPQQNQQQYPLATYPTGSAPYQSAPSYPQTHGYPNTGGYGPSPPGGQAPYPPMATGPPAPAYHPPQQPQESYQTKGDSPPSDAAPPSYADAAQSQRSAPPAAGQY